MRLNDGARITGLGAGPSRALFSFFLLEMAKRAEITLSVDIFEPCDFDNPGPADHDFYPPHNRRRG